MKQIVLWMARIFAMLLVFTMGASTQSVNAQDQTLAEGYYYINSTAYAGQGLLFNKDDKTVNRIHAAQHNAGKKVTPSDLRSCLSLQRQRMEFITPSRTM